MTKRSFLRCNFVIYTLRAKIFRQYKADDIPIFAEFVDKFASHLKSTQYYHHDKYYYFNNYIRKR